MFHRHSLGPPPRTMDRVVEVAVLLLLAAMLLAAIPMMARVPVATDIAPGPMPAPGPIAAADFPDYARVGAACVAISTRSSAVDNARTARAVAITTRLLEDACFEA